jgi:hypothetical protein
MVSGLGLFFTGITKESALKFQNILHPVMFWSLASTQLSTTLSLPLKAFKESALPV